jgi:glucose 1-dehydrogenase
MRALTFIPGVIGSARLEDVEGPTLDDGAILVETQAIGICGTDKELVRGQLGWLSPGGHRLILGHESLGRVREAPMGSGFSPGDLVVGIVRRPDPIPCPECASGEWDLCRSDSYTERGIKQRNGYASELFRIEPEFAVKVDASLGRVGVLLEPASVLAKAWEHIERIGRRGCWSPKRLLVTGAGPIGLLAALMGVQRGLEVHVVDRVASGPKPRLVRELGAVYHTGSVENACENADVIMECVGFGPLAVSALHAAAGNGIVCFIGAGCAEPHWPTDWASLLERMVVRNLVAFGSVSANRRHFEAAARALAQADHEWLAGLITRRVPLVRWNEALIDDPEDVKSVIEFADQVE